AGHFDDGPTFPLIGFGLQLAGSKVVERGILQQSRLLQAQIVIGNLGVVVTLGKLDGRNFVEQRVGDNRRGRTQVRHALARAVRIVVVREAVNQPLIPSPGARPVAVVFSYAGAPV